MNDFTYAWLIVASITLLMWLAQGAVSQENPGGPTQFTDGGILAKYQQEANLQDTSPYGGLPNSAGGQSPNDYTDEYRASQSWFGGSGGNFLIDVLSAPYDFLKAMHLPPFVVNTLGTFWYALLILLTAMMLLNREK